MSAERPKPSRRELLTHVGKGALMASIPASLVSLFESGSALLRKHEAYLRTLDRTKAVDDKLIKRGQDLLQEIYHLRVEFGIPVIRESFGRAGERYQGDAPTLPEARDSLRVLFQALGRYPHDFFEHNSLPQITFVRNITHVIEQEGETVTEEFSGLAQLERDWAIIKYLPNIDHVELVIHHELYHTFDFRDLGYEQDDAEWRRVQAACACGDYRPRPREEHAARVPGPFISGYSSTEPREDRATFASRMLHPAYHLDLREQMRTEPSAEVREAYEQKYALIQENYYQWSRGAMNHKFWNRLIGKGSKVPRHERSKNPRFDGE